MEEVQLQHVVHKEFIYNLIHILDVDTQVSFISMEKNDIWKGLVPHFSVWNLQTMS